MKTDTPETDTHQEQMEVEDLDVECSETYHLARKLERERDEARRNAEVERLSGIAVVKVCQSLEHERNESRRQHAADVAELNERLTKQQADMLDTIVELRRENVDMRSTMRIIYDATECCADGAPDASDHDKLCNEIAATLKPFTK